MFSRYEWMIIRRYLLPNRKESFISLVTTVSLFAVALGVAALVIVMSVMNGFRAELVDKIVGLNGQAVVRGYNGHLRDWHQIVKEAKLTPGVTKVTPLIQQPLFVTFNGRTEPVLARGMRMEDIFAMSTIRNNVLTGSIHNLRPHSGMIAIGSGLADALGAVEGSEISFIIPQVSGATFGSAPRIISYQVGAVFEVGVYDYDKTFAVMSIEDAQSLLDMGNEIGMIEIDTINPDDVGTILQPLARKVKGVGRLVDWRHLNPQLFDALAVERVAMFTVLTIIILVAAFNIASSLIMMVRAKTRDIAVLRTMGVDHGAIMRIFMTIGTIIGVVGMVLGLMLGFTFLFFRRVIVYFIELMTGTNHWDPSIHYLIELPSKVNPIDIVAIVLITLLMTFLSTLYPAFKAASTDPVQVLRYE